MKLNTRSSLLVPYAGKCGAIALLALAMLPGTLLLARQQPAGGRTSHGTLYLVGDRHLTSLDLASNVEKVWQLLKFAGMNDSPDCSLNRVPNSCDWYASAVQLDLRNRRLYFVAPVTAPGDESEQEVEGVGRLHAIWVISLEGMKLVRRLDLPFPGNTPTMLLTPGGKKLLVSYQLPDSRHSVVDTFDTTTFSKVSTIEDSSGDALNTYFPTGSYFLSNGKFIIPNGYGFRIRVEPGHFKHEFVDSRAQLLPSELERLGEFVKTEIDGQKVLPALGVSSRNGTTLVAVANDGKTKTAYWSVDMETGRTSPVVILSSFPEAMLIGSGGEFVTFEGHVSYAGGNDYPFARSGRMVIYDVKMGALVREFNKPELRGEGTVLCLSPDGSLAAYARGHQGHDVETVDFGTGDVKRVGWVTDLPGAGYSGACGFTE